VTLPLVSRSAALGNTAEFRGAIAHSLRLVMLLTIPSAIGLIILAEPIISLIYQHGRFTAESSGQTAAALRFYAIGLAAYSGVKVLAPAFYAVGKKQLPMLVSLLSIAVNFGLNWFFRFRLGWDHRGLALSTSLVAITNFLLLYLMMRRHAVRLETGAMIKTLAKLLVAGVLLAAICLLADHFILHSQAAWQRALGLMLTVGIGCASFFGVAYLLHVAELRDVAVLVRGRLSRLRS
jgi:putative peptidoglycan lipid II flippase